VIQEKAEEKLFVKSLQKKCREVLTLRGFKHKIDTYMFFGGRKHGFVGESFFNMLNTGGKFNGVWSRNRAR
jgi:hypothetical protein